MSLAWWLGLFFVVCFCFGAIVSQCFWLLSDWARCRTAHGAKKRKLLTCWNWLTIIVDKCLKHEHYNNLVELVDMWHVTKKIRPHVEKNVNETIVPQKWFMSFHVTLLQMLKLVGMRHCWQMVQTWTWWKCQLLTNLWNVENKFKGFSSSQKPTNHLPNQVQISSQHQVPKTWVKQHPKTPQPTKTNENPSPSYSMHL